MPYPSGQISLIKTLLRDYKISRFIGLPKRLSMVLTHAIPVVTSQVKWSFKTIEYTNFPYALDGHQIKRLAHFVSSTFKVPLQEVLGLFAELDNDNEFKNELRTNFEKSRVKGVTSSNFSFGRRYAWYAIVRILQPAVVIETGTDKGLGSAILSQALRKNGNGKLYTIDKNPECGALIKSSYFHSNMHVIHGYSSDFLKSFSEKIDFFIHDSDHSYENESLEYELISEKLSDKGLVASDNSGLSNALDSWSENQGRFLYYFEEKSPEYPGKTSGLGLSVSNF
jgi:hypothetical protein